LQEEKIGRIFHVVGERMSRYDFAIKVAEVLGLDKSLIQPAEMREMTWLAKRPRDSSLNYDETRKRIKTNFYSTEVAFKVLKEELA